jgi:NAD(P)-dependent dehydrogenase (short-subunit alcohol dehydrogenase family)
MSEKKLSGEAAVVTGGASGIGRATSRLFAREGAQVAVVDVNQKNIDETLAELEGEGHLGLRLDVSREADMEELASRVTGRFGRIDVLVACAAILRGSGSSPQPLYKVSAGEWDQVLGVNLRGMFLSNRAVLPQMIRQRKGNIVNLSSVAGRQGRAHDAPYCASKFGVIGMSEALAEEVSRLGVRVQVVLPDAVRTPIWEQNGPIPCPEDALPPERVAELILTMVTLPWDSVMGSVTIAPFKTRRRKTRSEGEESSSLGAVVAGAERSS